MDVSLPVSIWTKEELEQQLKDCRGQMSFYAKRQARIMKQIRQYEDQEGSKNP